MALYDSAHNGIILNYPFPTGQAGSYVLTLDDALIADSSITVHSVGGGLTLDADGYLSAPGTGGNIFFDITPPAKTTTTRKFTMWGKTVGAPAGEDGIRFYYNYQDGSNHYQTRFYWFPNWRTYMWRILSGSGGFISSPTGQNLHSDVDDPIHWLFEQYDAGDMIWANHSARETDDNLVTASDNKHVSHYTLNRPLKDVTRCRFAWQIVPERMQPRGLRIEDI